MDSSGEQPAGPSPQARPHTPSPIGDTRRTDVIPATWAPQLRPDQGHTATTERWEPVDLADLTADRRLLTAALHDDGRPAGADEGAVERLLLAFEELTSNALRHGRRPVEVTVTTTATCWVLEVSDAAADRPPSPAIGRDPARGGLGLHLVARICDAHGWATDGARKVVWARIDHTPVEARSAERERTARPRGHRGGTR